jgi:hypothetical protein
MPESFVTVPRDGEAKQSTGSSRRIRISGFVAALLAMRPVVEPMFISLERRRSGVV